MQTKLLAEQIRKLWWKFEPGDYVRLVGITRRLENVIQLLELTSPPQAYTLFFFFYGNAPYDRVMDLLYKLRAYAENGENPQLAAKMKQTIFPLHKALHELKAYLVEYMHKDDLAAPAERQALLAELIQKIQQSDKQIRQSLAAILDLLHSLLDFNHFLR
ncbi:MAG: hypothetical protein LBJ25_00100 [Candidatus Margulisbacteria bacterium]|jgi:hypothetical protein|nr:hypothetical protein [Candidatus Margulisiibacteriota bacterium]